MNDYVDKFLNNQLWIHISKKDRNLTYRLKKIIPHFHSEYKVLNRALTGGEAWFRFDNILRYTTKYPRTCNCRDVSPWIYDFGEIIDIKDFLSFNEEIDITEDDIEKVFK